MIKKEMIAMLLAGGQGSRLGVLTSKLAKPAVAFGGKYKIIEFPLSNCINSGIDTVGVLTQYQPLRLNQHIGIGIPWDLDRNIGGVTVLPPYEKSENTDWYTGTANAIYQNIEFMEYYNPDYVIILGGDHIYKMDYELMLDFHKKNDAKITLATYEVPWEDASRFGLMVLNDDNSIAEFQEKPKNPTSNKASMGVYIFTWSKLRQYLIDDENNPESSNDFGHDVIPAMHKAGERMFAYLFDGYWKDVGTIDSLWEANLDLLNPKVDLDLSDTSWKIYSKTPVAPPQYIAPCADIQNSMVAEGSKVFGQVDYSILFDNVTVEEGAKVRYSIIMPGATIKAGADVEYSIVAENSVIGEKATVGSRPEDSENRAEWGIAVVGANVNVGDGAKVNPKEMIDSDRVKEAE